MVKLKYKARLVAQAFSSEGRDFNATFSPVR
jgi:hypothetical protein